MWTLPLEELETFQSSFYVDNQPLVRCWRPSDDDDWLMEIIVGNNFILLCDFMVRLKCCRGPLVSFEVRPCSAGQSIKSEPIKLTSSNSLTSPINLLITPKLNPTQQLPSQAVLPAARLERHLRRLLSRHAEVLGGPLSVHSGRQQPK